MNNNIFINHRLSIPLDEVEITSSRASGPGGQHVNRTDSRISVRWNITASKTLTEQQREHLLAKLQTQLNSDGNIAIHCSTSRSQIQNKEEALVRLADVIRKALHVPKKRMATKIPRSIKEARVESKRKTGTIKKLRQNKDYE